MGESCLEVWEGMARGRVAISQLHTAARGCVNMWGLFHGLLLVDSLWVLWIWPHRLIARHWEVSIHADLGAAAVDHREPSSPWSLPQLLLQKPEEM